MMNMNTADNNKPTGPKQPAMPDPRNDLMESIRKGALLKKVDTPVVQQKTDLLSEIRGGIELRPVSDRPTANRSSGDGFGTDALADALKRALELRKLATQGDSSSSDTENSDENEWSDDN